MNLSVIPAEAGIHSFQIHSQIRKRRGRAKILANAHVGFKDGLKAKLVFGRNEHKACQLNPRPQTLAGGAHPSKLRITLSSIPFHMEKLIEELILLNGVRKCIHIGMYYLLQILR